LFFNGKENNTENIFVVDDGNEQCGTGVEKNDV
jgi:hypothetical protein